MRLFTRSSFALHDATGTVGKGSDHIGLPAQTLGGFTWAPR
jgi:hypothetical protein